MDVNNMNQALNEEKITFTKNDCIGYMIDNKEKYDIVKLGKSFLLVKKNKIINMQNAMNVNTTDWEFVKPFHWCDRVSVLAKGKDKFCCKNKGNYEWYCTPYPGCIVCIQGNTWEDLMSVVVDMLEPDWDVIEFEENKWKVKK